MNCLDFHRHKLADPRRLCADAQRHARECRECSAFAQSVDVSDTRLEQALNVAVPDGIAERVLLRQSGAFRPAWRAWALAASVILAVALGVYRFGGLAPGEFRHAAPAPVAQNIPAPAASTVQALAYARLAIAHVAEEPGSSTKLHNTEPAILREAMRSIGAELREPIGRVRYVKLCPWGPGSGWHIVFETPHGLATLILVPGQPPDAAATASEQGLSALVQPAHRGYYAVVTASAETTRLVDRMFAAHVRWKS